MPKCADCGFLSIRHHNSRRLDEVEAITRATGKLPPELPEEQHEDAPICFVQAYNLKAEMVSSRPEAFIAVLQNDRDCDRFNPWQQGFGPKEHVDMMQQQALLEWQRAREEAEREWRERQAAQEHEWREQQAERDRQWRREDRRTAMVTLLVGALIGVLTLIATLIAANKWPWFE